MLPFPFIGTVAIMCARSAVLVITP